MIVADRPWEASEFLRKHNTSAEHPAVCQTFISYSKTGEIIGATAFHHAGPLSVFADIATVGATFPGKLLLISLWYAFGSLKVRRLTMFVAASNLKSIAFVEQLGAHRGATLIDGCSDGDAYIYYLLPDNCLLWSKFNGKTVLGAGST